MTNVWLNGEFVAAGKARISPFDRGFLFGDGLFETFRLSGGAPCLCDLHFERLAKSAEYLGIALPEADFRIAIRELAAMNGVAAGAARLTVTRGVAEGGPRPTGGESPTLMITTRPADPALAERKRKGVAGKTLEHPLRGYMLQWQNHKTLSWLPSVLGMLKVDPGEEPILETTSLHVSETATANIFWVKEGALHTPSLDTGCLPGIGRAIAMQLAARDGLRVFQRLADREDVIEAEEAFTVNSVAGVIPLVSVDGKPVGRGEPGPVTATFDALLEAEGLNLPEWGGRNWLG